MVAANKYTGFSTRLMNRLAECRVEVEHWAEREKKKANELEEIYQETLFKEQSSIDSLEEKLLSVQFQLGINIKENRHPNQQNSKNEEQTAGIAQRQQRLLNEKERLQAEIARLKQEKDERNKEVKELEEEEKREQARAAEVRTRKQVAEESKKTTVEDLTRGIVNYKYLGLDFVKGENQSLRFCFTQIDPNDPSRQFFFTLQADDLDIYGVHECSPPIDQDVLSRCLHDLNRSDDLGTFVMRMRAAFVSLV